jgi:protein LSM14
LFTHHPVHSFGTEGRKGNPSEEIPPSENVFDFIVFRGSDIKDLQVFEPPAPKQPVAAPQQYPNDPAIMV